MGYYTSYDLDVIAKDRKARDARDTFYQDVESGKARIRYVDLQDLLDGTSDSMKWYEWKDDMLELSKQYPDLIFQLNGAGREDEFDYWRAFFKNGKMFDQRASLSFPEPDFSKLD